jgi:hypothetical protein
MGMACDWRWQSRMDFYSATRMVCTETGDCQPDQSAHAPIASSEQSPMLRPLILAHVSSGSLSCVSRPNPIVVAILVVEVQGLPLPLALLCHAIRGFVKPQLRGRDKTHRSLVRRTRTTEEKLSEQSYACLSGKKRQPPLRSIRPDGRFSHDSDLESAS